MLDSIKMVKDVEKGRRLDQMEILKKGDGKMVSLLGNYDLDIMF